jgi:hypothetical protein
MTYSAPNLEYHRQVIGLAHEHHLETRILFSGTMNSATWPVNNLCLYIPIYVWKTVTVYSLFWVNGATASGNACMGLYDEGGNRIAQTGVVAQSGTTAPQQPSITAFQIPPGRYWAGLASTTTAATFRCWNVPSTNTDSGKWLGIGEETVSAGQVPTTMTPVASARAYVPLLGLRTVSQAL